MRKSCRPDRLNQPATGSSTYTQDSAFGMDSCSEKFSVLLLYNTDSTIALTPGGDLIKLVGICHTVIDQLRDTNRRNYDAMNTFILAQSYFHSCQVISNVRNYD